MNEFKIIMPEGSYNYYEEVLKNVKEYLKTLGDKEISAKELLDFIRKVEKVI